jgi:vacuolar-type H+-ATPase subunit H
MDDLLSDILVVEREVRKRIDAVKEECTGRLEELTRQLDRKIELENARLQDELDRVLEAAEHAARREGDAHLSEARAFAERLGRLTDEELAQVIEPHLQRLRPEKDHDRQDVQT